MSAAKGFVFPGKTVEGSRKTDEDKELNFLRIQNRVQRRMILKLKNKNTKIKNSIDGKTFKLREEIVTLKKKNLHIEESLMMKIHLLEDSLEKEQKKQKSVIEDIFDVIDITDKSESDVEIISTPKKGASDPVTPKRKRRDPTINDVETPSKVSTKSKKRKTRKVRRIVPVRRSTRSNMKKK